MFDLDAYLARIGYAGPRAPTLATLSAVHALHPRHIPFENIEPLLGRPVSIDIEQVQRKLVGRRRGGYCFEHNTLFESALEALGFTVTGLVARVYWRTAPDAPTPARAHMILRVPIAGEDYIADVGFGLHLGAAPVSLVADVEQSTPAGKLRLLRRGAAWTFQVAMGGDWQDVYRFELQPQHRIDYEMANWFTSTHPNSRFRQSLMLQKLTPGGRVSLLNRRLSHRFDDGRQDERELRGPDDLARALVEDFALDAAADAPALFARLPAT